MEAIASRWPKPCSSRGTRRSQCIARVAIFFFVCFKSIHSWGTLPENCPPPPFRIDRENPLIILQEGFDVERVRDQLDEFLPADIRPFCYLQIETRSGDRNHPETWEKRLDDFRERIVLFRDTGVRLFLQVADPDPEFNLPIEHCARLLDEFPDLVVGLQLVEMQIEHFTTHGSTIEEAMSPIQRYAISAIETCAKRGKYCSIQLQMLRWPFVLSADTLQPFYETCKKYNEYVLPQDEHIGPHHWVRMGSLLGMWLDGAMANWGVEPQSWMWENAQFVRPGLFGPSPNGTLGCQPSQYRAMILMAASAGATVYSFEPFWDMWDYHHRNCWYDGILPTLREIVHDDLIVSKEEVLSKARCAYQMQRTSHPVEFGKVLADIDCISGGEGNLERAAYGFFQKGLETEWIPNANSTYWIPYLSHQRDPETAAAFDYVFKRNEFDSPRGFREVLDRHMPASGKGRAAILDSGRNTFVFHTHENLYEEQAFTVDLPVAPRVTGVMHDEGRVRIVWNPVPQTTEYFVERRLIPPRAGAETPRTIGYPEGKPWPPVLEGAEIGVTEPNDPVPPYDGVWEVMVHTSETAFEIAAPTSSLTLCVRARTDEKAPFQSRVNFGDTVVFSNEISRRAEILTIESDSHQIAREEMSAPRWLDPDAPKEQEWWRILVGVPKGRESVADAILDRFLDLKRHYESEDLEGVAGFYNTEYKDPNGYSKEYVVRAWKQWFYRYHNPYCYFQPREWDFSAFDLEGDREGPLLSTLPGGSHDRLPLGLVRSRPYSEAHGRRGFMVLA